MILQLNPGIPLTSPKGACLAIMVTDYGTEHDLFWTCIQDDTGEIWTWANPDVRAQKNVTWGRTEISPFYDPDDVAFKKESLKPGFTLIPNVWPTPCSPSITDPYYNPKPPFIVTNEEK